MSDKSKSPDFKKAATDAADIVATWSKDDRFDMLTAVAILSPMVAYQKGIATEKQLNYLTQDAIVLLAYYAGVMFDKRRNQLKQMENN